MPVDMMPVEIWAPGLNSEPLKAVLAAAQLTTCECATLEPGGAEGPLLLAYTDPVGLLPACGKDPWPESNALEPPYYQRLLGAISWMEGGVRPWRLVNLSCICPPALVAWCVQPHIAPPCPAVAFPIAQPEAFDALLAWRWLEAEPQLLERYLRVEHHPLAAALDHRVPDDACGARLQQASTTEALAQARSRVRVMLNELEQAEAQREELHRCELNNQSLRDQLVSTKLEQELLTSRIQALEAGRSDLQISLMLCQQDQEQLIRRASLLEQLVNDGAQATRSIQDALAKIVNA